MRQVIRHTSKVTSFIRNEDIPRQAQIQVCLGALEVGSRGRHEVSLSWNPGGPIVTVEKMPGVEDDIASH